MRPKGRGVFPTCAACLSVDRANRGAGHYSLSTLKGFCLIYGVFYIIFVLCNKKEVLTMSDISTEERKKRVCYVNFIIRTFAYGFKRPVPEVVEYLDEFGGL